MRARVRLPGQRLTKSQQDLLEQQAHAHLSPEQVLHLGNLRAAVEQAQAEYDDAQARYVRATERRLVDGTDERMSRANHRRMEAADALNRAQVAQAACEKAFGVRS